MANTTSSTWVALLRGINVGGNNKLPMATLVTIFQELGCTNVATYIQSGNVVFQASDKKAAALGVDLPPAILKATQLKVPVVIRSAGALQAVLATAQSELAEFVDLETGYVMFLADQPSPQNAARLDPNRAPGDHYRLVGREIYLQYGGSPARSKLTNDYFDRTLGTTSTSRNWRTVAKLIELSL